LQPERDLFRQALINCLAYRLVVRGTQHGQVRFAQQGQNTLPVQAWRGCLGETQQVFEIGQRRRLQASPSVRAAIHTPTMRRSPRC
jgi:hypothetical protein